VKIFVIPDVQAKPGHNFKFLHRVGKYIAEKQPDVVVQIGDFADMPSLSSYDKGKRAFEGRRYVKDIAASHKAMETLLEGMATNGGFKGRMVLTLGNHEDRILRAANETPELEGLVKLEDLKYETYGWNVQGFLHPCTIGGVVFCHYLTSGVMGRPVTAASRLISTKHVSTIVGHQQGRQVAYGQRADGRNITAIIAGSCYEHHEDYMGPQGNKHWRGLVALHEVKDGQFDEMFVSLDFLKKRYK
jgi:hypothetical protein